MAGNKSKTQKPETVVQSVVEPEVQPVVEPASVSLKGGKGVNKVSKKSDVVVVEAAPAPAQNDVKKGDEVVVEAAPVQKAGKGKKVTEAVVEAAAPAAAPAQKGGKGKKVTAVAPTVAATVVASDAATEAAPVQDGGKGKKAAAAKTVAAVKTVKTVKKAAAVKKEDEDDSSSEVGDDTNRRPRSFKVKLPNKEVFEGRFTGLTPYQAANKALSKWFRDPENTETESGSVNNEITFSIWESTRKSKKALYTYTGKRLRLEIPVKYTIQDGREITKNFKNVLKKVKKSEVATSAPASA